MVLEHDPFADGRLSSTARKKRAFLVGREPGSRDVFFLAKMVLYRGQSINFYHLVTGEHKKIYGRSFKSFNRSRDEFILKGHEIPYSSDIHENNADKWVEYGRKEAIRLGLVVHDWPFQPVDD